MDERRRRLGAVAAILVIFIAAAAVLLLEGCAMLARPAVGARQVESVENTGVLVEGAPRLSVVVPNGRVRVAIGEAGRVAAVVTRRGQGPDKAAAQAALDNLRVAFAQRGDLVTLEALRIRELGPGQGDEALLEVTVPEGTALDIRVGNGQAELVPAGADGTVAVTNGQVTVTPRSGDAFGFEGKVSNGTITSGYSEIRGATGQQVEAGGTVGKQPTYSVGVSVGNGEIAIRAAR